MGLAITVADACKNSCHRRAARRIGIQVQAVVRIKDGVPAARGLTPVTGTAWANITGIGCALLIAAAMPICAAPGIALAVCSRLSAEENP